MCNMDILVEYTPHNNIKPKQPIGHYLYGLYWRPISTLSHPSNNIKQ